MRHLEWKIVRTASVLAAAAALGPVASAQVVIPADFESAGETLNNLFSYFGGVGAYGANPSTAPVHSGNSLEVWADFQPDPIFNIAGFALGSYGISGSDLSVPAGADTFSITIAWEEAQTVQMIVTLREDDNGDGVIDVAAADDEWEAAPIMVQAGTHVYNVALADFADLNEGVGNDAQGFDATGRLGLIIAFESRGSFPGGVIEAPITFNIDHVGLFAGAQEIPEGLGADFDGNGLVDAGDLGALLGSLGVCGGCPADLDGDGTVDAADLAMLLGSWGSAGG
ncbi:MAG: hypothetical protein VYC34_00750 [Planctomycetota bacterium]|nr:hypothetical protein [Planctomycetota bacterium]